MDEIGKNLAPPTRPRYQSPLQNPPMKSKNVTTLAYLTQSKLKKITPSNVGIFFLWRGKVEHLIKTDCRPKKVQFSSTKKKGKFSKFKVPNFVLNLQEFWTPNLLSFINVRQ